MPTTQRYVREEPETRHGFRLATALRDALSSGYGARAFRADAMAGLVVGVVALPLSMALAIASGVPPQYGIYTAIVAGGLIAALGGSATNVSGPTAAFVVLLAPIAKDLGLSGLVLATLLAGAIQLSMGAFGLGRLIQFIPHPVTTGFTAGIAVVIATLQLKDFFGLTVAGPDPEHYWDRVAGLVRAAPTVHLPDLVVGAVTLTVLFLWSRVTKRVPSALIAVLAGAGIAVVLQRFGHEVATIGSRFSYTTADGVVRSGIPSLPPMLVLPWNLPGPTGSPLVIDFQLIEKLIGPAFAIALLGGIESLLCAVVADGMAGTHHDPDVELCGQGIGNLVVPFFGGFAATGAIARTATSIRSGGRSPIAAIVHALFVLAAVLVLGNVLGHLPMATLAALLLYVAWNMSDVRHFRHVMRVAPKSDIAVLLTCFSLTVLFDMVIAVGVGFVLAALLFMRRMAEVSTTRLLDRSATTMRGGLPEGVLFYEIAGPLFFGAAEKAVSMLNRVPTAAKTAILHVGAVPIIDVTGMVALESAIERLNAKGIRVIIAGIQPQPAKVFKKSGIVDVPGRITLCRTLEEALALASAPQDPPTPLAPGAPAA